MKRVFTLFFFIVITFSNVVKAQVDQKQKIDSVEKKRINGDLDRVSQLSAERLSDSLKLSELRRQVEALGTQDETERNRLILELKAIKKKIPYIKSDK